MVSSKDILEKTGLKNAKTLTRWYQKGIIPEPFIGTHPSGRGKMAYWPDWVLDQCVRIVELQKQGHSLISAIEMLQLERIEKIIEEVKERPSISDILKNQPVNLKDGPETNWLDVFLLIILAEVKAIVTDPGLRRTLLAKMRGEKVVDDALNFLRAGYNPILLFDGTDLFVTADFMVGHRLSDQATGQKSYLLMPLLPPLRKAFTHIDKKFPGEPNAYPAPRIWVKDKDLMVEYDIFLGGPIGFELIRATAKTIGIVHERPEKDDEA